MNTLVKQKGFLYFLRHHLISAIFIFGFLFDIVLLPAPDHFFTIILGTSYILLFATCLFLRELIIKNNKVDDQEKETYRLLTFLISFFSGSSLSYIFTYSLRSADTRIAAPFLLLFFIVLLSNELVSSHRFRLLFDYVLLVISSSFYSIYMMPLLTGSFDDRTLSIGIFSSALIIFFYNKFFSSHSEFSEMIEPKGRALAFSLPLFIFFLALNFLLPPAPFTVEKIVLQTSAVTIEKEETLMVKLREMGKNKEIRLPYKEEDTIALTTIYTLPDSVTSAPEHHWYRVIDDVQTEIPILEKKENLQFESRSLMTKIKGNKGNYLVITKVGHRVIREEHLIIE